MPLPPFLERFRRGPSQSTASDATPLSSSDVEIMRVRARRRLIGMVVLVGAGIVGFPWLFETKPRPMAGDIQIVAAQQAGSSSPAGGATIAAVTAPVAAPGALPASLTSDARASASTPSAQQRVQSPAREVDAEREEFVTDAPAKAAASKPAAVAASKPAPKPVAPAEAKVAVKQAEKPAEKQGDKAKDKPKDKPTDKSADKVKEKDKAKPSDKDQTRYVVQFGAFADAGSAHEARMKAEKLGLKTYAQQVDTPQGKRIRVRLGPFADKAEADKAAATLRKANLPGAVLTL